MLNTGLDSTDTLTGSATKDVRPERTPRQVLSAASLEFHLLKPRRSKHPLVQSAYRFWRDEWRATLRELTGAGDIHSDEFTRQDEISVLSIGGLCVSVSGLRWLNLSDLAAREDSYFKAWPAEAMALLGGSSVCVVSNTVVHPEWRGALVQSAGESVAESTPLAVVTLALAIRRFMDSEANAAIGVSRNDRAMHRVAVRVGGNKLGQILVYGIESDLIRVSRADANPNGPVMDGIWARSHRE